MLHEVQEVGGPRESASGERTSFIIEPSGSFRFVVEPFANLQAQWTLDGANLSTTPNIMEFRVDAWTETTLDLFIYGKSEHWFFRRS